MLERTGRKENSCARPHFPGAGLHIFIYMGSSLLTRGTFPGPRSSTSTGWTRGMPPTWYRWISTVDAHRLKYMSKTEKKSTITHCQQYKRNSRHCYRKTGIWNHPVWLPNSPSSSDRGRSSRSTIGERGRGRTKQTIFRSENSWVKHVNPQIERRSAWWRKCRWFSKTECKLERGRR